MALGADAVYIGSIALVAMLQTQMNIASPFEPPVQTALYHGKFKEDIDVEKGAEHLAKFLESCVEEMRMVAYALGKTDLNQIDRSDLVCVDRELARLLGVDYCGFAPGGATTGLDGREGSLGFCRTHPGENPGRRGSPTPRPRFIEKNPADRRKAFYTSAPVPGGRSHGERRPVWNGSGPSARAEGAQGLGGPQNGTGVVKAAEEGGQLAGVGGDRRRD